MHIALSLILELIALVLVISAIQLIIIIFRNPFRAGWLRNGFVETLIVLFIVTGVTLALAFFISGMIGVGVNIFLSLVIGLLIPIFIGLANDRIFHIQKRLRQAEAGASPFSLSSTSRIDESNGHAH